MSTYLELCQDLILETGISGTLSTVSGQTGEFARVVGWVKNSWLEIQNRHNNWRWMRRTASVQTVADDDTYAPSDFTDETDSAAISRFARWRNDDLDDPAKAYLTATGKGAEYWLSWIEWNWYKSIYRIGNIASSNPAHTSFDPNNNLVIGPKPNDVYTVTTDYQMAPQILVNDSDTPDMPTQYHKLIVYRAMEKYGGYESAVEVVQRAATEGNRLMRQLEINQLEPMRLGTAMA